LRLVGGGERSEQVSHVDDLLTDPASALFAGLAILFTLAESPQSCSAEFPTLLGHQTT
jgi:hypothetical protein